MKGQMFVVTMVFLIGLIFAVQVNLSQYTVIKLGAFETNDLPLLRSIEQSFETAVTSSVSCPELDQKSHELEQFIERQVIRGTAIEVNPTIQCSSWQATSPSSPLLSVTVHLRSFEIDTTETFSFSN